MSDRLTERLNAILPKITSQDFLSGHGIGNEIPFYVFDYPPEDELRIREHVAFLVDKQAVGVAPVAVHVTVTARGPDGVVDRRSAIALRLVLEDGEQDISASDRFYRRMGTCPIEARLVDVGAHRCPSLREDAGRRRTTSSVHGDG
jgi:hypothetical protein